MLQMDLLILSICNEALGVGRGTRSSTTRACSHLTDCVNGSSVQQRPGGSVDSQLSGLH